MELLEHASGCNACGALLADLYGGSEGDRQGTPLVLRSSTPVWKEAMLERMTAARDSQTSIATKSRPGRYWIAAAAALVGVVLGSAWWAYRMNSAGAALRLLARAGAEQRTVDLRFPGAPHGQLRLQRGGGGRSFTADSPQLLEGETRIAKGLANHPEDAGWLLAKAYADLLRWHYSAARGTLENLLEKEPSSIAATSALAISWYESAEAGGGAPDYGRAAELFSSALRGRGPDPAILFNRALTYEKLQLPHEAEKDWERLLKLEPAGGWAEEAKSHLAELRKRLNGIEPHAPARVLADLEPGDPKVLELLKSAYPDLPQSAQDRRSQDAQREAALLADTFAGRNRDWWLQDLLAGLAVRPAPSAVRHLFLAAQAGQAGDADAGLREATLALDSFRTAGNSGGVHRARYEILYAFQRRFQSADCLATGRMLTNAAVRERFPWLYAQALHELASCSNMVSDFASADRWAAASIQTSQAHGFRVQWLRGIGIRAGTFTKVGNWREAWNLDAEGLGVFWSGSYPPMRAYQFYSDMATTAEANGSSYVARALIEEAVKQIDRTGNVPGRAMAHAKLGRLALATENPNEAASQFAEAEKLFGSGNSILPYRVDGEIGRARAEARLGDAAGALRRLQTVLGSAGQGASGVQAVLSNRVESVRLFRALAEVQRQVGNRDASEQSLRKLVALAEEGLASLASDRDRLSWVHDLDEGYRGLVHAALERNRTEAALNLWEWYRAAESRTAGGGGESPPPDWAQKQYQRLKQSTMLTLVELSEGIAVWRYDDRGVLYKWIPVRKDRLDVLARDFAVACADPTTSTKTLRDRGAPLYAALITPVADGLLPGRPLVVEPDGSIALIPFEALPSHSGHYLGEEFRVVVSPGLYSFREEPRPASEPAERLVTVGDPQTGPEFADLYPPLPDALQETQQVAALYPDHVLLSGAQATAEALRRVLPGATIFHFAGHAISLPVQTGLVLAGTGTAAGPDFWNARTVQRDTMRRCRLAVLSACATSPMQGWGIAEPDNLARALLASGVRNVIASRWPVDSRTTRELMECFYRYLKEGEPVSRALHLASAKIRNYKRHPYYWAAFTAFGGL